MRILVAIAVVSLAACGTDYAPDEHGTSSTPTVVSGEDVFLENCSQCHGADGKGTKDGPTILSPVKPFATYVIRHGRGIEMGFPTGMDAWDTTKLSDEELNAVLDWLSSAPKPTTGPELYGRFCINCHGANARSGRVGKNIVSEVGELTIKVRYGHGGTLYGARTSYMPAWGTDVLTDADLSVLRSYILTL